MTLDIGKMGDKMVAAVFVLLLNACLVICDESVMMQDEGRDYDNKVKVEGVMERVYDAQSDGGDVLVKTSDDTRSKVTMVVDSDSAEAKSGRQTMQFFVADDGKSIKLPKSDLIYNPETGEMLIRNRNYEKKNQDASDKQNYFNLRSEDLGFKNLQGFLVADGDKNYAKHYTYPSSSSESEEVVDNGHESDEESKNKSEEVDETSTGVSSMNIFPADQTNERNARVDVLENHTQDMIEDATRQAKQSVYNDEYKSDKTEDEKEDYGEPRFFDDATEESKEAYIDSYKRNHNLFEPMIPKNRMHAEAEEPTMAVNGSSNEEDDPIFITTTQPSDPLSVLRAYMEDIYLRGPIAVVVDTEEASLAMAKEALSAMEQAGGVLNITDIVLIAYNANGITWMSHHKATTHQQMEFETKSFMKALNGLKVSKNSGRSLPALVKASRLLPYDSAIFLFSNRQSDSQRTEEEDSLFVAQLLTKRIKLYVVCGGSGEVCRGGAAKASGGGRVHLREKRNQPEYENLERQESVVDVYYDSMDENPDKEAMFDRQDVLLSRKGMSDISAIDFPVDSGVKTLTISITGSPEKATLQTPTGEKIQLFNEASVEGYSKNSEILSLNPTAAVRIMIPDSKATAETTTDPNTDNETLPDDNTTWTLTVKGSNSTQYNVQIDAESNVHVFAKVLTQYSGPRAGKRNVKISIGGQLASVWRASVINEHGKIIGSLSEYKYKSPSDGTDFETIETIRAQESGIATKVIPLPGDISSDEAFYVQIEGFNDMGEPVLRLSQELQIPVDDVANIEEKLAKIIDGSKNEIVGRGLANIENDRGVYNNFTTQGQVSTYDGLPMTLIQIGSASRLHGAPGVQMQIHFEVTNNRQNSVFFRFHAKDDQYFLRTMIPQTQWIGGGQTVNVILTVGITSNAENNVRDTILFTATGLDQTTLNAYVYVVTDGRIENDRTRPELSYSYRGDCMGYLNSNCNSRTWGLDITARDSESGLMRITTSPSGVIYGANFYAGSREETYARYTASCCTQRVHLSAVDLNGNIRSYDLDVSNYLTPATIAAIVLGVLLFIALIIVAILIIRWIVKRKRDSRELPSYQTQRVT